MTKEEKADLELKRANAKTRCDEVFTTIQRLKHILADYYKDYYRWRDRYLKADRELAMAEKLTIANKPGERRKKEVQELSVKLTKEQIIALAEELGFLSELNFDEEGE